MMGLGDSLAAFDLRLALGRAAYQALEAGGACFQRSCAFVRQPPIPQGGALAPVGVRPAAYKRDPLRSSQAST